MARRTAASPPCEVFAIRYGTATLRRAALLVDESGEGDPSAEQRIDYFFWLVRRGQWTLLVDTGFSQASGASRGRTMLREPAAALRELQGRAGVSTVLLTHLHYDHTGNLELAAGAPILVGGTELDYWERHPRDEAFAQLLEEDDLAQLTRARAQGRLRLLADREAIAPGVAVRCVGGHTPGQLVVEVETGSGAVILASDALHFYEELRGAARFAATLDVEAARAAAAMLGARAKSGTTIVAGHDPAVCDRFPAVGESLYRVA